jgi:type IV pilus biogenesis protein CpaD/CtpE
MRVQSIPSLRALCGVAASALLAACTTVTAAAAPAPPGSRTEKWIDLQVGECVADLPPADLSRVTVNVVDCATAHLAEVYLRAPMTVNAAVANVANKECSAGFAPYTGRSVDGSPFSITFLIDSNQDRTGANPTPSTVICLLQAANGQPLTGSAHR